MTGILLGGVYALLSIGLTLIFGVMRVINFAHGEFLMLAMYGAFWLNELWRVPPYAGLLIVTPPAFVVGLLCFRALIKPAVDRGPSVQLFVTMGLSVFLQNLALFLWKADFRSLALPISSVNVQLGPVFIPLAALVAFLAAVAATAALWAFLQFTHLGRAIRATGQDPATAPLMGIDTTTTNTITFGIGTALVALAGAIMTPVFPVFPAVGAHMVLVAFVVVVLGGLGSVPGAWLGGIVAGLIDAGVGFYLPTAYKDAIFFVAFLLMLVLRPSGFLGVRGAEEVGFK